jgi:hypothetical protein
VANEVALESACTLVLAEEGGWDVEHVQSTFQLLATISPLMDTPTSKAMHARFSSAAYNGDLLCATFIPCFIGALRVYDLGLIDVDW